MTATTSPSPPRTPTATSPPATPARSTSPAPTPRRSCRPTTASPAARQRHPHLQRRTPQDGRHPDDHRDRHGRRHHHRQPAPRSRSTPAAATHCTVSGFTATGHGRRRLQLHRHRQGRLRQHRHRLHRHGPLHQQRRPGGPARPTTPSPAGGDNGIHTFTAPRSRRPAPSRSPPPTRSTARSPAPRPASPSTPARHPPTGRHGLRHRPTAAGDAHDFTVTARDAYGNTATGYTGTVHFTSSDGAGRPARRLHLHRRRRQRQPHLQRHASRPPAPSRSPPPTRSTRLDHRQPDRHHRQPRPPPPTSGRRGFTASTTAGVGHELHRHRPGRLSATSPPATPARSTSPAPTAQAVLPADYTFSRRRHRRPHLQRHAQDGRQPVDHRHRHGHARRSPAPDARSPSPRRAASPTVSVPRPPRRHGRRQPVSFTVTLRTPSATSPPATPARSTSPAPTAQAVLPGELHLHRPATPASTPSAPRSRRPASRRSPRPTPVNAHDHRHRSRSRSPRPRRPP